MEDLDALKKMMEETPETIEGVPDDALNDLGTSLVATILAGESPDGFTDEEIEETREFLQGAVVEAAQSALDEGDIEEAHSILTTYLEVAG